MDDDELTISSHDSMDDIRRMVAEAQAAMRHEGTTPTAADVGRSDVDDDELTVQADEWVMAQIHAGLLQTSTPPDDEATIHTQGRTDIWDQPSGDAPLHHPGPSRVESPMPPPGAAPTVVVPPPPPLTGRSEPPDAPLLPVEQRLVVGPDVRPPEPPPLVRPPATSASQLPPSATGERWQPPARLVNPKEPGPDHPHDHGKKWKLVSAGLAVGLVAALALGVFAMLGDDGPADAPTGSTLVDGSIPTDSPVPDDGSGSGG